MKNLTFDIFWKSENQWQLQVGTVHFETYKTFIHSDQLEKITVDVSGECSVSVVNCSGIIPLTSVVIISHAGFGVRVDQFEHPKDI